MLELIAADIKQALLGGDKFKVEVLKMLKSALTYERILLKHDLSQDESVVVVRREIKKRRESADMYAKASAVEKSESELSEITILDAYAPKLLSGSDLDIKFNAFIAMNSEVIESKNFGMIMKAASGYIGECDKQQLAGMIKTLAA